MGNRDDIQKAGVILKELFSHLNFNEGEAYVSFFSDWMELAGVDLACHVRPFDIRRDTLLLEVDHPGWMQMFQLKQKRILHRIQEKHPSLRITSVHFRLKSSSEEGTQKNPSHEGLNRGPVGNSGERTLSRQQTQGALVPSISASISTRSLRSFPEKESLKNERLRRALEKLGKQIKKQSRVER